MVEYSGTSQFTVPQWLSTWRRDTNRLLQNRLLDEGAFIRFSRDRGRRLGGVVQGEPSQLHGLGWLVADEVGDGALYFHPFRLYVLDKVLGACDPHITAASFINRDQVLAHIPNIVRGLPSHEQLAVYAAEWNVVVDLAVLLEPIYWPRIAMRESRSGAVTEQEYTRLRALYSENILGLVRDLDEKQWRRAHENLRLDASWHDSNGSLYLLLRLSPWPKRERLRGSIAMALWFRHMAELIRRAFEEAHDVEWPEEDQAGEMWTRGTRVRLYGAERPLDRTLTSRPYLAFEYGLYTGSVVRWYVEGVTEYFAVLEALPEAAKGGIELVNLRGSIAQRRGNAPMSLSDGLRQDLALRRFSIISFDMDVEENVRTIRRQVEQGHVVGVIAAHKPDFEFANFSLAELVEIAARIDESHGVSGAPVREGNWDDIRSGGQFEARYLALSERRPGALKGEEWGRALARFALDHPSAPDVAQDRPFIVSIGAALRSRIASYDYQKMAYIFDRNTFELVHQPPDGAAE